MNSGSVLQEWVMDLPLREQGVLLTAVRACDDAPKKWNNDDIIDTQERRLTSFIRFCFMNPADPREVDIPGAFFQSKPPEPFKPSSLCHLPLHWFSHCMHALEIIAYRHPNLHIRGLGYRLYFMMVKSLHLNPELQSEMVERLSEDRIKTKTVVS